MVGGDPSECSNAIHAILSMIEPLSSKADVRPYLTIQNGDAESYIELCKKGKNPNVILGVSSPLLAQNFKDIACELRLD